MGSWSVYCGISNITITSGERIGIIPLVGNEGKSNGHNSYLPAMLPVFGIYDDYGGIEDIEENENTKLIEKYFGVSIQEFVQYLIDGKHTYCRDEAKAVESKLLHCEETGKLLHTFISGEVYDFLSETAYGEEGKLEFGNKTILELIGFKYLETLPKGRYNEVYERQGVKVYADGTWVNIEVDGRTRGIYRFDAADWPEGALTSYIKAPEDKMYLAKKAMWQVKEVYTTDKKYAAYLFGRNNGTSHRADMLRTLIKIYGPEKSYSELPGDLIKARLEELAELKKLENSGPISNLYLTELEVYGKDIADLYTIIHNARMMSKCFEPYKLYVTPQCGEHQLHLKMLKGFTEILEPKVLEEDE